MFLHLFLYEIRKLNISLKFNIFSKKLEKNLHRILDKRHSNHWNKWFFADNKWRCCLVYGRKRGARKSKRPHCSRLWQVRKKPDLFFFLLFWLIIKQRQMARIAIFHFIILSNSVCFYPSKSQSLFFPLFSEPRNWVGKTGKSGNIAPVIRLNFMHWLLKILMQNSFFFKYR